MRQMLLVFLVAMAGIAAQPTIALSLVFNRKVPCHEVIQATKDLSVVVKCSNQTADYAYTLTHVGSDSVGKTIEKLRTIPGVTQANVINESSAQPKHQGDTKNQKTK